MTGIIVMTVTAIGCLFAAGYLAIAVRMAWMRDDGPPCSFEDVDQS